MNRLLASYIVVIVVLLISASQINSQGFDYLKKNRDELNKDITKKPTLEQLKKTTLELTKFYYENNFNDEQNVKQDIDILQKFEIIKNLDPSLLLQQEVSLSQNNINYCTTTGLPIFITINEIGSDKHTPNLLNHLSVVSYFEDNKQLFKIDNPNEELTIAYIHPDNEGNKHIKLQQQYKNVPIWGKEIMMHYDKNNSLYLVNGRHTQTLTAIETENYLIDNMTAEKIALDDLGTFADIAEFDDYLRGLLKYEKPRVEKYIWQIDDDREFRLVWFVDIKPNIVDNWRYVIDAFTGDILEKYNTTPRDGTAKGTGKDGLGNTRTFNVYQESGTYWLIDITKPMFNNNLSNPKGMILTMTNNYKDLVQGAQPVTVSSQNNQWNDPFSVSAHYNTALVYDYYKNVHNRNSLDDKGMDMLVMIHVTDRGQPFDNAYWNGQFVVLGDGGQITNGWPPALDFNAHEFTHGVVTFTVDLEYKFQSGALNEGFADWGAAMVDRANWTIGEDIVKKQYFPSGSMRDMANPHNGGTKGDHVWLPAHMNEFLDFPLERDNGGVHYNCGIINKATYLIGASIGREKLEKIYYRVLNNRYLTKQSKFIDMRLACIKSAEELFGVNSSESNVVRNAFEQVGITDGTGTKPNPDLPAVDGSEWIAFVSAMDFSLYKAKPVIQNPNTDMIRLTATPVYAGNNGTITVPENGASILFIDQNHNLKSINTDGTGERILDASGTWRSIAISPNGRYLSATSVFEEPVIYLFDLMNSSFKEIELFTPSTGNDFSYTEPLLANTMTWDVNNEVLVYDALNYKFTWEGNEEIYMDMNAIDAATGVIYRIFPTMGKGISVGSPDFGKTSNRVMTFLVYDDNEKYFYVNGVDLFSGNLKNIVYANANQIGISSPVYSVRDNKIAFQISDFKPTYGIMQVPLQADKISGAGSPTEYLANVGLPKWFAIGKRPVVNVAETKSNYFDIYPNPSDHFVNINFDNQSLMINSEKLIIYNIFGQIVKSELINHNTQSIRLDISGLIDGTYFVKAGSNYGKFVKVK